MRGVFIVRRNRLLKEKLGRTVALYGIILASAFVFVQSTAALSNQSDKIDEKFNMSYIYFGDSASYPAIVNETKGSLNDISPSYFDLNTDGTLKLTNAVDLSFINKMHVSGIEVTPFLSNHWSKPDGIAALDNRELLSSQVAAAVMKYNLDGVNVDIENITEAERSKYTDFVRLLREKLPQGRSVSAAVAPNPNNVTTGWNGSYDYAALTQYCDYLMLMAYDEHFQGGAEGPVAGASFVERSIKYAIAKAPANKIVLGIPFYGRIWKQGASNGGYGISADQVEVLIGKYRGVVTYDTESQSPKAVINIKKSDVKPYVFGIKLEAGKYDIWYENNESIKYKLKLVGKYDLKGTGSWSLGQEAQSTWDYYKLWLNGCYFTDVEGYWAMQSVIAVADKGWMQGVSDTVFSPKSPLTRAQAAVILVKALGLEEVPAGASGSQKFIDISGHWANKEIGIAQQHNIIKGVGGGKFAPDSPVTRAQMAVMLGKVLTQLQYTGNPAGVFKDVNRNSWPWAYDYIANMTQHGIIQGYPDGLFHPGESITRAQMAILMDKASGYFDSGTIVASR